MQYTNIKNNIMFLNNKSIISTNFLILTALTRAIFNYTNSILLPNTKNYAMFITYI